MFYILNKQKAHLPFKTWVVKKWLCNATSFVYSTMFGLKNRLTKMLWMIWRRDSSVWIILDMLMTIFKDNVTFCSYAKIQKNFVHLPKFLSKSLKKICPFLPKILTPSCKSAIIKLLKEKYQNGFATPSFIPSIIYWSVMNCWTWI